jgi:tetratricopeptide (TPR) repeat protein
MPLFRSGFAFIVLLSLTHATFSQTLSTKIAGVTDPPELAGEPKVPVKPNEVDTQFWEVLSPMNDPASTKAALPQLGEFIRQHPDYVDAYYFRATTEACELDSRDFPAISEDLKVAMSHGKGALFNTTESYSLLAKIAFATAKYMEAVDDLEKAMSGDLSSSDKMFNISDTEPQTTSKFCSWNLSDLDILIAKFPRDYRVWLFRGLYYKFFTTFKEEVYPKALENFQKAALLNPKSPLPPYFMGEIYMKASFWTKKAWASDVVRDEATKNAIQAYSKAIRIDPQFLPAYKERASGYLNLKQYAQAIEDFTKVHELDPNYAAAFSDEGIAKLESGQYFSAISAFNEAIRLKGNSDIFLPQLYEYRGDAEVKTRAYADAVADYSKAIERRLSNDIYLFSLRQFRSLYPEYDTVSDEILCHKLHGMFFPEMKYADFSKHVIEENGKWSVSLLNEFYEKRGDVYLLTGDYRRGVLDFNRIYKGMPSFAESTDRWRLIGTKRAGERLYLDAKSAEFPKNGPVRLWTKTTAKKETTTTEYEIDCKAHRLNVASIVIYDSNDNVTNSSEASNGWQHIVPDTLGEQLYNGACSGTH